MDVKRAAEDPSEDHKTSLFWFEAMCLYACVRVLEPAHLLSGPPCEVLKVSIWLSWHGFPSHGWGTCPRTNRMKDLPIELEATSNKQTIELCNINSVRPGSAHKRHHIHAKWPVFPMGSIPTWIASKSVQMARRSHAYWLEKQSTELQQYNPKVCSLAQSKISLRLHCKETRLKLHVLCCCLWWQVEFIFLFVVARGAPLFLVLTNNFDVCQRVFFHFFHAFV